ncbi:conjugative transposon protein TraM [Elizabethkingia anophelis]|uniref:conjugative transposon protein TraM n=1 Tax=Elizabethkingia anophelis TaxID=1117645 RepID=UPI0012B2F2ED|nr:conjugative transposon protein TraM [Elizabethkingia anophelis]QGN22520.1 conjugative transposon protein TraM [Elizabethkingia anophelis]QNV09172.1 conjugative transposon protein TraM [Elizabethkingia anophelis]UTF90928.1 conjugative transposon protein TraM [Elizabethkingia anophelis]UTG01798.1 conjugative transposon protein TraM [Elizabethkingia anophelis]UTG05548.1 conjugative transposon protein TraM [Elizabethkingia anophelis]
MNIDFRKPRYVIPLILLPFLCIFFYVYKSSFGKDEPIQAGKDSLQTDLAGVSDQVRDRALSDKLDAYRNQYRQADGYTAIGSLQEEQADAEVPNTLYNEQERRMLDSIDRAMKGRYGGTQTGGFPDATDPAPKNGAADPHEKALQDALAAMKNPSGKEPSAQANPAQPDPMALFRQQMELLDSMGRANDPEYRAEKEKLRQAELLAKRQQEQQDSKLEVTKTSGPAAVFNTVTPERQETFITAIVDQDIKGYAGSRLRIRLLEDMMAGRFLIKKGTYIYAEISGFTGQRVTLAVTSIMNGQHILPVRLEVYDHDGLPGLYVPASAFREFTRDLGGNASQGITLQQAAENNSQLVMSMVQKMFQSTSTAVSKMIRQNKAKIKYNTLVYLIDPDQLKNNQKNY